MVSLPFIAQLAGMIASMAFFVQYLPQAWLNYQRRSVKGFSTSSIVIKLIGAAFLFVNATWTGEAIPVVCYGLFNVVQHSIFMVQFYLYYSVADEKKSAAAVVGGLVDGPLPGGSGASGPTPQFQPGHPHYKPVNNFVTRNMSVGGEGGVLNNLNFGSFGGVWLGSRLERIKERLKMMYLGGVTELEKAFGAKSYFLLWILFPIVPLLCAILYPDSITYTNSIKPIGQIMSHIPQVVECLRLRTTLGISMSSQHLNFIGGACGLLMCIIIPPIYTTTYIIYFNSVFQAITTYAIAAYYREPLFPSFGKESPALPPI